MTKIKPITILPSIGRLPDGTQKPLNEMTADEREQFRERLQGMFQKGMTDYFRNRVVK